MKLAAAGIACIALGSGASHLPMIGLVGLPLMLVGWLLLTSGLMRAGADGTTTRSRDVAGQILGAAGAFGVMVCAAYSTGLVWRYLLGAQRPGAAVYRVETGDVVLAVVAWFALPSLVALGMRLRTAWAAGRLLGWWVLVFSAQPAAVVVFLVVAAGAPLSA